MTGSPAPTVRDLVAAIASGDEAEAMQLLDAAPHLARGKLADGATRQHATANFYPAIECYLYAGDTPLHAAAAAWSRGLIRVLTAGGADVGARNRRGATAMHY